MKVTYFVVACAEGSYLRFERSGSQDVVVRSHVTPDGPWVARAVIPAAAKGWVAHSMALLGVAGLLFGQHAGYVKGTEEDVKRLRDLLAQLS